MSASAYEPIPPSASEYLETIRESVLRASSPWCDRAGAGAYCSCSISEIDAAANRGEIKRYWRHHTPMFKKADLDKWIENSPIPATRVGRIMRKGEPAA